jgi:hypothetical protein
MVKITGKNGKPLYGVAREAVLRKLDAESRKSQEKQEIMLLRLSDCLNNERAYCEKYPTVARCCTGNRM